MIALALAVACSLAIGMIFKHAGQRGLDRLALLTVNYAAALAVAAVLLGAGAQAAGAEGGSLRPAPGLLALGVTTGALFIFGFFMLSLATDVAGMSLAIGVMRISVVIPFLASWAVWGEAPSAAQGAGLVVAGAAFFMIARREEAAAPPAGMQPASPSEQGGRTLAVLALLFLAGGAVDVLMKAFDEAYAEANSRALFLLLIFGVAFGIGAALVLGRGLQRGVWPRAATLGWGAALGVVNYGSVEFILRAIRELSGPFVFPANNIAIVIGAALLGVGVWGERLSRLNQAGLALAALALFLLSVGR